MSDFSDGIANVSALTTQLNQIKESGQVGASPAKGATQADINAALLEIEKSFSSLLDGLLSSGDDKKKNEDKYDPFSALESYNQAAAATGANSTSKTGPTSTVTPAPSSATDPALNYINVPDLDLTI